MSKSATKPKFKLTPQRGREVFLNRRAIIALTVSTVTLLTLLQPNRELLLNMLDDANDPTVALAFLNVLRDGDEPAAQLDYLIAKQYVKRNDFEEAVALIEPADRFLQTPYREQINELYTRSLWQLATLGAGETAQSATAKLHTFLSQNLASFSDDELSLFAQYALQTGSPVLAYQLNVRNLNTSENELLTLARQAGLSDAAYQHALQIYRDDPTFEHVEQVLAVAQQNALWDEGIALAEQHAAGSCDENCLQSLINFLVSANAGASAAELAYTKAQTSTSSDDWLQATERALAIGELDNATIWLERVVTENSTLRSTHRSQLVDLYVGVQRFDDALALMQEFIGPEDSPELIRYVIQVAFAAINIEALEEYLYALATQGVATLAEIRQWISFADRLNGAAYVAQALFAILNAETANTLLEEADLRLIEVELARFYNFVGDQQGTVALWRSRHPDNILNVQEPYSFVELNEFIQAFVDLSEPETALEIAANFLRVSDLDDNQLADIQSLAYFNGDREMLRQIQEIQLARGASSIDPFLLIATHDNTQSAERERLWIYYDLFNQNRAAALAQLSNSAQIILDSMLQGAIIDQDNDGIARIKDQLSQYPEHQSIAMLELRLRVASYEMDNQTSRQLLQQLISIRPSEQRYQEDAVWIAIALDDEVWLQQLYQQLFASAINNADLAPMMAYAAQALENTLHAQYWYQKLTQSGQASAADLLSYATLLQNSGDEALSQALRWQVVSTMADELQDQLNGDISYRSLLSIFVGPAHASERLSVALAQGVTAEEINSILFTQSRNGLQQLAYWQTIGVLQNEQLSETVQLALALARKDEHSVRTLALQGQTLTDLERTSALTQIDERTLAWQYGEQSLNPSLPNNELAPLQRLLANEHWHRSHGWSYAFAGTPSYGLGGSELEYYRPLFQGQMQINYSEDQAEQTSFLNEDYSSKMLLVGWQNPNENYQLGLQNRHGKSHASIQLEKQWQAGPWLTPTADFFWNIPATQSENLALAGRQSGIQLGSSWQLTSRTNINANIQARQFRTDFSEKIGDSRQLSLRISDTLQRVPTWQPYMQYDLQVNSIASGELTRLMERSDVPSPITADAFLSNKFHRLALGQRVSHGTIGRQGPDVKGARYLLDTSIGYNFELEEPDLNVSFGLGIRVFGGDELSITGSWQNADINGQTSTQFNIKYFLDF